MKKECHSGNITVHNIGHTVRNLRKLNGLTQIDLAELAGVGKTSVFDIEKGKPTVRLQTLLQVLDALNVRLTLTSPMDHGEQSHA